MSIELLERAADALEPLLSDVVFLGGASIVLWITDPAAPAPRPTKDVDVNPSRICAPTSLANSAAYECIRGSAKGSLEPSEPTLQARREPTRSCCRALSRSSTARQQESRVAAPTAESQSPGSHSRVRVPSLPSPQIRPRWAYCMPLLYARFRATRAVVLGLMVEQSKHQVHDVEGDRVRRVRLRVDGQRPLAVNLEETISLTRKLFELRDAALRAR